MHRRSSVFALSFLVSQAIVILALAIAASAQTFTVLYNFGSKASDPYNPTYSGVIAQGRDGNLYTTLTNGGANGYGAVVKLTTSGAVSVIYSFDFTHGSVPSGGLTLGTDGNFYGTTADGGDSNAGTIFKITPAGVLTTLHSFDGGAGGSNPYAPPVQGADSNWYGTTNAGGGNNFGTLYRLTTTGTFTSIYSFDGPHGFNPRDPLVLGADGNLYGTTLYGGSTEQGNIFKITDAGVETVLYAFDYTHGELPTGGLIQGLDGNFYGTTEGGGSTGSGVVFKVTPGGVLTVLHNLNGSTDGTVIYPGLVQASDGALYGVSSNTSTVGGTIFKSTTAGTFTTPYTFPVSGSQGFSPQVTPVQHTNGILYGDTNSGGTGNVAPCSTGTCGVFYSLNNKLPAFIKLLPYTGKVGAKIGILGQGFSSSSVVKFNGVPATTVTLTGTMFLLATVPAGATDGYVTVTTGTTTLKSLRKFTVHNSWSAGKVMPTAVQFPATGTIGAKIYVVGGVTSSALTGANQVYAPAGNTWTTAASIPTPVYASASAVVNGLLYVIGGYTSTAGNGAPTGAVQVYNATTNMWTTKTSMPTARGSAAAVVDGGMIYVIGGNGSTLRLNTVEKYNPATDTWTTEAPLLTGKSEPSASLVGTTIVAAGGFTASTDTGDNEGYNVSTNKWSALTFDPTPRNASCFGSLLGQLYVAGGGNNGAQETLTESFNVSTNKWTTQASMPQAVISPGSAVSGGLLYCFGGSNTGVAGSGTVYNNVQVYQP